MRRRVLVLPISAAIITAACVYKLTRSYDHSADVEPETRCAAMDFDFVLENQHQRQPVRLQAFLGRHRILVVFYDGEAGAEADPTLRRLRDEYGRLKDRRIRVLGISTAIPQQNRPPPAGSPYRTKNQPQRPFPFALLSDLPPACLVHKQWGRWNALRKEPLDGVFFIDRSGYVACDGRKPKPIPDPDALIDRLLE